MKIPTFFEWLEKERGVTAKQYNLHFLNDEANLQAINYMTGESFTIDQYEEAYEWFDSYAENFIVDYCEEVGVKCGTDIFNHEAVLKQLQNKKGEM